MVNKDRKPNNILISGMTGCGKTCYLLSMLENEYYQYLHKIFLICPTLNVNKTYLNWKYINDSNFFVIQSNHDEVDEWVQYIFSMM